MKRLLTTIITTFILFAMIGCGQVNTYDYAQEHTSIPVASAIPETLGFWSLEEFLYAHRAVREGRAAENLARLAELIDFADLEEFHLLTGLPGSYQIDGIAVYGGFVTISYLPERAFASEDIWRETRGSSQSFHLQFQRWTWCDLESWGLETPLDGIMRQDNVSKEDLIDGKFHFVEWANVLYWSQGSSLVALRLPNALRNSYGAPSTVQDLLVFAETTTIDLLDDDLIAQLIGDFYQLSFNLGFATNDFPPVSIPSGAGIFNFITTNHEQIPIINPTRRMHNFSGWYLDAEFTVPLSRLLTMMPAQDTTLYARWEQYD